MKTTLSLLLHIIGSPFIAAGALCELARRSFNTGSNFTSKLVKFTFRKEGR